MSTTTVKNAVSEMQARAAELEDIVTQYPRSIPVEVVARFLGCDVKTVHHMMEDAGNAIGASWQRPGRRGYKIPTLKFYLWMTGGRISI